MVFRTFSLSYVLFVNPITALAIQNKALFPSFISIFSNFVWVFLSFWMIFNVHTPYGHICLTNRMAETITLSDDYCMSLSHLLT